MDGAALMVLRWALCFPVFPFWFIDLLDYLLSCLLALSLIHRVRICVCVCVCRADTLPSSEALRG